MSPALAILAVAALHLALLAPLALALWRTGFIVPALGFYALLLAATASYQAGLFERADVPKFRPPAAGSAMNSAQCAEILTLLDRAGVIIDRRSPPRLAVAQARWEQLPPEGQQAVISCVQRAWPANAGAAQLEVRP